MSDDMEARLARVEKYLETLTQQMSTSNKRSTAEHLPSASNKKQCTDLSSDEEFDDLSDSDSPTNNINDSSPNADSTLYSVSISADVPALDKTIIDPYFAPTTNNLPSHIKSMLSDFSTKPTENINETSIVIPDAVISLIKGHPSMSKLIKGDLLTNRSRDFSIVFQHGDTDIADILDLINGPIRFAKVTDDVFKPIKPSKFCIENFLFNKENVRFSILNFILLAKPYLQKTDPTVDDLKFLSEIAMKSVFYSVHLYIKSIQDCKLSATPKYLGRMNLHNHFPKRDNIWNLPSHAISDVKEKLKNFRKKKSFPGPTNQSRSRPIFYKRNTGHIANQKFSNNRKRKFIPGLGSPKKGT